MSVSAIEIRLPRSMMDKASNLLLILSSQSALFPDIPAELKSLHRHR